MKGFYRRPLFLGDSSYRETYPGLGTIGWQRVTWAGARGTGFLAA